MKTNHVGNDLICALFQEEGRNAGCMIYQKVAVGGAVLLKNTGLIIETAATR